MVRIDSGEGEPDEIDRIASSPEAARDGWERTIEDAEAMVADREAEGFETLLVPAGDTTPKNPDTGDTDEWGLTYVVPDNERASLLDFLERADFDETLVYQRSLQGNVFIVTECIDADDELSLFLAGAYRMNVAPPMVRTAMDRGRMLSHVKTLDETHLHTIEHDDPESFFPDPEEFYAYETDEFYWDE